MRRITSCIVGAAAIGSCAIAGGPETRLVQNRPVEGRFVSTDRGYMVSYQQPIPGSNAAIEMVPVPGGTFTIGPLPPLQYFDAHGKPKPTETPSGTTQSVSFGPFWIGKYEITMEQYMPYRRLYYQQKKDASKDRNQVSDPAAVDAVTGPTEVYAPRHNFEYAEAPNSPVPSASHFAARQYTKYLSLLTEQTYRLPLRSEWQHACLAGGRSAYCFGNDDKQLKQYAVYRENTSDDGSFPLRVGTKQGNPWGLFDMHGNVSEFVIEDSAKTGMRYGHVACGGNCDSDAEDCTATSVIRTTEDWWDDDPDFPPSPWWMTSHQGQVTGFRIMSPLEPMSEEQKKVAWDADSQELASDVRSRLEDGRGSLGRVAPLRPTTWRVDAIPPTP